MQIAMQCPAAGGQAVYRARAMIELINDTVEYNDAAMCLLSGIYKTTVLQIEHTKLPLVPNPAKNRCTIVFEQPLLGSCVIEIKNALGQRVYTLKVDNPGLDFTFDTSALVEGVYLMTIKNGVETYKSEKLIIIR